MQGGRGRNVTDMTVKTLDVTVVGWYAEEIRSHEGEINTETV